MRKSQRPTALPTTPALVRRTASIAAVAAAVGVAGCSNQAVPPQVPTERAPQQAIPPQAPPPPQVEEPQIAAPQIPAPQVASPPPQIPQRPTPVKDD